MQWRTNEIGIKISNWEKGIVNWRIKILFSSMERQWIIFIFWMFNSLNDSIDNNDKISCLPSKVMSKWILRPTATTPTLLKEYKLTCYSFETLFDQVSEYLIQFHASNAIAIEQNAIIFFQFEKIFVQQFFPYYLNNQWYTQVYSAMAEYHLISLCVDLNEYLLAVCSYSGCSKT